MTHGQQPTQKTAGNGHEQAEGFDHPGNLVLGEADVLKEDVGNDAKHNIRDAVKTHEKQKQQGEAATVALEKVLHRVQITFPNQLFVIQRG